MNAETPDFLAAARELHHEAVVVDSHVDTTQRLLDRGWDFSRRDTRGHVDLPRIREGGIDALVMAVWCPPATEPAQAVAAARRQVELIQRLTDGLPEDLALARTPEEVRRARSMGRVALLIGIEGGHLIANSLEVLAEFHSAGAVYLTLTHAEHTDWADSAGVHHALPPRHRGLTDFGREVVQAMNRMGMIVDVSHVSDETFRDVLEVSSAPVIASHSSCRAVAPHRRNLSDEMMRALADVGGVIQINFGAAFVDPAHPPLDPEMIERFFASGLDPSAVRIEHCTPLSLLVDHIEHALQVVGPRHVGLGSDFDGVPALPTGLADCSNLPRITAELLRRGRAKNEIAGLLGANFLRVMEECQAWARRGGRGSSGSRTGV